MEKLRTHLQRLWPTEQDYEPLENSETEGDGGSTARKVHSFSYVEYGIFVLLGVSMLWAWNMFLAAGPYFQKRFHTNQWILDNFQAAELLVSNIANLGTMLILSRMQAHASYSKRIITSLLINMVVFSLLAMSTAVETSAGVYFGFLMIMTVLANSATGFCQNGIFAYVSGFAEPKYTQGIMTGQAIAGVLPCIAQIVSVLSVQQDKPSRTDEPPVGPPSVHWTAALAYFLTATGISVITLFAFSILLARNRHAKKKEHRDTPNDAGESAGRKTISLLSLLRKLIWPAAGVFLTFAVTMFFPVFTQQILSVKPPLEQARSPLFQAPSFIPLALLFWNAGDLLGRLITAVPTLSLESRPRVVFGLAVARTVWVGMYYLCNIRGRGAIVDSDFFYLVVVQLFFGISNGYVGSMCMIGLARWVDEEEEREAAGGFMGLCLVFGMAVGSLLSFSISST